MKKILTTLALLLGCLGLSAAQDYNCFSVIAGRDATVDGSVLMAHNEDDSGEQMLNIYVVPGGERNLRYIWCEFPGMEVSDVLMNQFGVSIASNGCPSREDKGEFTGEGVLYEVRMAVAKYARTAREAVSVIGSMVETFGYKGSGRSYIVADPSEGWVVSVVKGKHWVAQRVPDDKVMTIPNYYVIQDVDLDDEENFAGSEDIIEYAISRGWYDPAKDGAFSFARAYASEASVSSLNNRSRHHEAWTYFFGQDRPGEFAAVPPQESLAPRHDERPRTPRDGRRRRQAREQHLQRPHRPLLDLPAPTQSGIRHGLRDVERDGPPLLPDLRPLVRRHDGSPQGLRPFQNRCRSGKEAHERRQGQA